MSMGVDSVAPRTNTQRVAATDKVSKEFAARVARMEGAHNVRSRNSARA